MGFSRGAFTARSVAGMIGQLGLLTREGVEHFYPIFKDMQNWQNDDYDDPFPTVPFRDKPKGPDADDEYRQRLEKLGFTRVTQAGGDLIKVKAVCVWDTVGSLGVPKIAWLEKLGIRPNNDEQVSPPLRAPLYPAWFRMKQRTLESADLLSAHSSGTTRPSRTASNMLSRPSRWTRPGRLSAQLSGNVARQTRRTCGRSGSRAITAIAAAAGTTRASPTAHWPVRLFRGEISLRSADMRVMQG